MLRQVSKFFSLALIVHLAGCAVPIPPDVLRLSPENLTQRQLQTRQYDTIDEAKMLSACAEVLQDLGFTLDDSETTLGLVVGSKNRGATDKGQVAGAVFITALAAIGGTSSNALDLIDASQKIRASVVTAPLEENRMRVRVTFQRLVWNRAGALSRVETLDDPSLYQGFFEKLSQSVFLEAHNL